MGKTLPKVILAIVGFTALAMPVIVSTPTLAAGTSNCVQTTVLGNTKCAEVGGVLVEDSNGPITCSCDDGTGGDTTRLLNLVVDIFSIIVGILAVIGISITGIQYLTAGGNEERTRKAKRRLFEIVIGIVLYVLLYSLVHWLMP